MLIGAFGVLAYRDIKKIAAYQVILSIGFIILGLGTNTIAGVNGAIFYIGSNFLNIPISKYTKCTNQHRNTR
jgi:multicomponent Na+:H+ antiporter subunit D